MANVLGSAAGTIGYINAMGLATGSSTVGAAQGATAFTRVAECLDLSQRMPAPLTFNFAATAKLFMKMFVLKTVCYLHNAASCGRGYHHRLISFYNEAGKVVFSIGFLPYDTKPAAFSAINYMDSHQLYIFFYGDSSSLTPTSYEAIAGLANFPYGDKNTPDATVFNINSAFTVAYNYDAAIPANSTLSIEFRGLKYTVANVATKLQTTSKTIAAVKLGDSNIQQADQPSKEYGQLPISYVVIADDVDYSLKAEAKYPTAFTANNKFSGVVSAVSTALQDTTYVSSSAEVASIFEVELADLVSYGSSDIIYSCSLYLFLRYVQSGGTSINMTVALVDAAGAVHATAVVAVPANVAETYYNTRLVLHSITSAITSAAYTLAQFNAMRVRISLA